MQPLRITFTLMRPLRVPEYPIHLDALLAWAAVEEARESGDPDWLTAQERLPLASEDGGGCAVWCASQLLLATSDTPHPLTLTKRFAIDALARAKGRVYAGGPDRLMPGTGPYKAFVAKHPMTWVHEAVAYAIGDAARITELLVRLPSIGKLRRIDAGLIERFGVVPDPRACEAWRYRVMPWPVPGYVPVTATTRPPYWDRTQRQMAWRPLNIPEDVNYANQS